MNRRKAMAVLALVGVFVASYMALHKLGLIGTLACTLSSCELVQNSRWATLMGLPVAVWGVGYYVLVLALCLIGLSEQYEESRALTRALAILTGWGLLFSGWLTSLEAFAIKGWCQYCLASATLTVLLFGLALLDYFAAAATETTSPS